MGRTQRERLLQESRDVWVDVDPEAKRVHLRAHHVEHERDGRRGLDGHRREHAVLAHQMPGVANAEHLHSVNANVNAIVNANVNAYCTLGVCNSAASTGSDHE